VLADIQPIQEQGKVKGIHTRIKSKENKVVHCAQREGEILGIFPERVRNNQRMILCRDSAQRGPQAQLQDTDSTRC